MTIRASIFMSYISATDSRSAISRATRELLIDQFPLIRGQLAGCGLAEPNSTA